MARKRVVNPDRAKLHAHALSRELGGGVVKSLQADRLRPLGSDTRAMPNWSFRVE